MPNQYYAIIEAIQITSEVNKVDLFQQKFDRVKWVE